MDNFIVRVPCPRALKVSVGEAENALIKFFQSTCLNHRNINVQKVRELISSARPCGYVLHCDHKMIPEDKLICENEGKILGIEQLLNHIINEQKKEMQMNINEYEVEFFDENQFQVSIYLHCSCSKPTSCLIDNNEKLTI